MARMSDFKVSRRVESTRSKKSIETEIRRYGLSPKLFEMYVKMQNFTDSTYRRNFPNDPNAREITKLIKEERKRRSRARRV